MRGLIFDPFAGVSGDMILGALIDLGLPPEWLRSFIASLGFDGVSVVIERAQRRHIDCGRVRFELPHEHAHRHLSDVLRIIERSGAPSSARDRASDAFRRLASAEAEIHGTSIEKVHFHEVGALDAILDVLCAMAAVEELGFEAFFTRPIAIGTGWIEIDHGRFPVPAPATLRLLSGMRVRDTGLAGECTTPTGAAIVATLTGGREPPPEVVVHRSGFGAGTRDDADRPNCLRLIACEVPGEPAAGLHMIQADLDDMVPEYVPPALDAIMAAGAVDVVVTQVLMKKGRPGMRIEALASRAALDAVIAAIFHETTTLGVRHWPVERDILPRHEETIEWRGHAIRRKRVRLPSGEERAKPEYEDVRRAADALGIAPRSVRAAIDAEVPADGR
ncbi:MAG TPA: nickel pincer cofactor biosynthesis protein LarC [Longimicrobiales bacterium]|nr:nickel pincer cofactor biosynthesis protein LarC [Longimicrobiales bacterium]